MNRGWGRALLLVALSVAMLAGCVAPTPRPSPTASPRATATTPLPTAPPTATRAATATPAPTAIPSPTPVSVARAHLGVAAGDTFGLSGAALDDSHARLYVLGSGNDPAARAVLSVVDLGRREVVARAQVPTTVTLDAETLALARDATRLYVLGIGQGAPLWVLGADTAAPSFGKVLATLPAVRAMALDREADALYLVRANRLLRLNATSLTEEASLPLDELASLPPQVMMALNPRAGRLYLGRLDGPTLLACRVPELEHLGEVQSAGLISGLYPDPTSARTYLLTRTTGEQMTTAVEVVQGEQVTPFLRGEPDYPIGQLAFTRAGELLALEDHTGGEPARSRLRILNAATAEVIRSLTLPYLNLSYAQGCFVAGDALWRLASDALLDVNVQTGALGPPLYLWISLVAATLDPASERCYVLDSAGTLHVLAADTLRVLDTWPGLLDPGFGSLWGGALAWVNDELWVSDLRPGGSTLVIAEPAGGHTVRATIPRGGKIALDARHGRVYLTNQGVWVIDPRAHTIVRAIEDTLRQDPLLVAPGAIGASYDAANDLLLVTMSNNSPGSGNSSWLQVYDGQTLDRLQTSLRADHQFVAGLAVDEQRGRIWLASAYPGQDLASFAPTGALQTRLVGLGGPLTLDAPRDRLYVRDWGGLVALDAASAEVVGYTPLADDLGGLLLWDPARHRFLASPDQTSDLVALDPQAPPAASSRTLAPRSMLPSSVTGLALDADSRPLVAAYLEPNGAPGLLRAQGAQWARLTGGLPARGKPTLLAAGGKKGTLFAYGGDSWAPWGLFRSTDGGQSWQAAMKGLTDFTLRSLATSPLYEGDHTALCATRSGLWRTRDEGASWTQVATVSLASVALAADGEGALHYLALGEDTENTEHTLVYGGSDGATAHTFGRVGTLPVPLYAGATLALSPDFARDGRALAGVGEQGLYLTRDAGATWQRVWAPSSTATRNYAILALPPAGAPPQFAVLAYPGYYGPDDKSVLLFSPDAGDTWRQAENADPALSALALGPQGQLWAATTGGDVAPLDMARLLWQRAPEPPAASATPAPPPPQPTAVPIPTAPPPAGPSPTAPAGLAAPQGRWEALWQGEPAVHRALGWAKEAAPHEAPVAFQPCERGAMIWRGDTRAVIVLRDDGTWAQFPDTWVEGQPETDAALVAPSGLWQPKRGFGKVWREQAGVRAALGWATAEERGYTSAVQGFERGMLVQVERASYLLYEEGGASRWQVR